MAQLEEEGALVLSGGRDALVLSGCRGRNWCLVLEEGGLL